MDVIPRALPFRVGSLLLGIGVFNSSLEPEAVRGIITHVDERVEGYEICKRAWVFLENGRHSSYRIDTLTWFIGGGALTVEVY